MKTPTYVGRLVLRYARPMFRRFPFKTNRLFFHFPGPSPSDLSVSPVTVSVFTLTLLEEWVTEVSPRLFHFLYLPLLCFLSPKRKKCNTFHNRCRTLHISFCVSFFRTLHALAQVITLCVQFTHTHSWVKVVGTHHSTVVGVTSYEDLQYPTHQMSLLVCKLELLF